MARGQRSRTKVKVRIKVNGTGIAGQDKIAGGWDEGRTLKPGFGY